MENKLLTYGLIIQVTVLSWLLLQAEKKVSFYEGCKHGDVITVTPDVDGTYKGYQWTDNKPLHKSKTGVH